MRHKNSQGIAYSVFPFGSSQQMFLVGEPEEHFTRQNKPDYPKQVRNLLENVKNVCEKEGFTENVAAMCHFFIADIGMKELVRQVTYEMFPQILGAVTFVPQAPASGAVIALELWAMTGDNRHFSCKREYEGDEFDSALDSMYAVAVFDKMRWFLSGGILPDTTEVGAYDRSSAAFDTLYCLLENEKFRLKHLLRTWIYQGRLVLAKGETQRYKELNRARTDFFGETEFLKKYLPQGYKGRAYPASTGIGADDFDVVISAVALDTKRKDVIAVPLENPNQTSAFDY